VGQTMLKLALVLMLAATVAGAFAVGAYSQEGPGGPRRGSMMPFEGVLRPDQKQQFYSIVKADKKKIDALHQRMHAAREALIQKLFSPGPAPDLSKEIAELKSAQAAMIDERVTIALAARKLLSPQQLKDAAAFHSRLEDLHRQEAQLMEQMESSKAAPGPGQE
jgi:Spy/CpxP family protein refolding chaperone